MLVLGCSYRFKLGEHVLKEQQRAVVDPRQTGAEASREAYLVVLLLNVLLLSFPVHAEGGIGEEVVEGIAIELVVGKAVAEKDVVTGAVVVYLFHKHVRGRRGVGASVVVLPEDEQSRLGVVLAQVVLSLSQHTAGAAGRIQEFAHCPRRCKQIIVLDKENVHHQPDHFAGREVIAGCLVCQFVETTDKILEDKPHLLVRNLVGV